MKKQTTEEIKKKILWKGTTEEAIKLGKITQEEIDEWDVNDEIEKAEIRGRREGRLSAQEDNMKEIEFAIGITKERTLNDVTKIVDEFFIKQRKWARSPETPLNKALVYLYEKDRDELKQEIARLKGEGK